VTNTKFSIVAGLLFCLVIVPSARAQVTIDVSKITCKEFLNDTITVPDNIAYWLSGYYNGKRGNTVFDANLLKDYVNKVQDYCIHNEDVTVMKAAEILLGVSK
jgi:acid stress chaperone HdeB